MAVKTACKLRANEKGFQAISLKPFFNLWAHQGTILGPPDYESGALTN
jgi:hypothetical protein